LTILSKKETIAIMQQTGSVEKGLSTLRGSEGGPSLIVAQPQKLEGLLETIALLDRISERVGEDCSGDMGSGGSAGQGDDATTAVTLREQRIAALPSVDVMRRELSAHIQREVKTLQREVRKAARRAARPGAAHRLNLLYARIRRLNRLMADLLDAAYEVLKRLFIRVVIDGQKVL
jgi:signal transduction histidine kinase